MNGFFFANPARIPVEPDSPEAHQLLVDELSKPQYQAARPTWFDLAAQAINDWLSSLLELPTGAGFESLFPLLAVVVLAGLIIATFLIFGRPRYRHKLTSPGTLFGSDDARNSAELRASAAAAFARGDFDTAIEEIFRAIARRQTERTIIRTDPGTTAQGFARRAGSCYPDASKKLLAAAQIFDGVRYLGVPGTAKKYQQIAELERELSEAKPVNQEALSLVLIS